jgi:predicted dehydrogenase
VELAQGYPMVTTAVGYCHRFVPAILEMQRMLRAGELGTVVRFENTFACWFPQMAQRWMSDVRVSGGGSLIDTGSHSLDLFRFLLGQGKVVGASFRHEWEGRGESNATVLVQGGSSAGVIASGWAEPARFIVSLVGTRAMASYDYDRPQELHIKPSQGEAKIVAVETHEVRFERQLLAFAEVASGRADRGGLASFEDGLAVAQMVAEAQRVASII